jgi:hypothetical protein
MSALKRAQIASGDRVAAVADHVIDALRNQ